MSAEKDILYKMKITTTMFLNMLKQVKKFKDEIAKDIDLKTDNLYFVENPEIYEQFNDIFDDASIENLTSIIYPFIDKITEERDKICEKHEYIKDVIDIGFEDSQTIYYCKFCRVSKKCE